MEIYMYNNYLYDVSISDRAIRCVWYDYLEVQLCLIVGWLNMLLSMVDRTLCDVIDAEISNRIYSS